MLTYLAKIVKAVAISAVDCSENPVDRRTKLTFSNNFAVSVLSNPLLTDGIFKHKFNPPFILFSFPPPANTPFAMTAEIKLTAKIF